MKHREYMGIVLTSAGIGSKYTRKIDAELNKYKKGDTIETFRTRQGFKIALPMYWRNKIYSDDEREALWMEKLDKGIRYVNGRKIDVRTEKGMNDFWKVQIEERAKNKRLGYGDNEKNWSREKYENELRNLKMKKRIESVEIEGKKDGVRTEKEEAWIYDDVGTRKGWEERKEKWRKIEEGLYGKE
nr:replication associated protein [Flumine microvirus 1]